jgi:hypothetical protein
MESYVSEYPEARHDQLSVFYTRQVKSTSPYTTRDGEKRVPGQSYVSKFKNMGQQKKIFSLLSHKKIPYRRTTTLGKSILHTVSSAEGGIFVHIGTNIPYASNVIGDNKQQSVYMALAGWKSLEEDEMKHLADLTRTLEVTISAYLTGILG